MLTVGPQRTFLHTPFGESVLVRSSFTFYGLGGNADGIYGKVGDQGKGLQK